MHAFLAGDADVLVSTTIIESGIDIPQANTLIVERADMLGLAQLYQIRGRSGARTSSRTPLFYPEASELTPEARARLTTLADSPSSARGSRSRCATSRSAAPATCSAPSSPARRGARVRAVRRDAERGRGRALRPGRLAARPVRVDARVDAYVPRRTSRPALKIDLHRRIALVENEDEPRARRLD